MMAYTGMEVKKALQGVLNFWELYKKREDTFMKTDYSLEAQKGQMTLN